MLILLTNDDGIFAPGLVALEHELRKLGEVHVVAPLSEQSGVSHSITYRTPIIAQEVFYGGEHWGWAVDGTPADCVKMGVSEFLPRKPDLVVSGINGGLNAGINVLYSGTMAAAIEGAFFDIPSFAVSLEFAEHAHFDKAATIACSLIDQVLQHRNEHVRLVNLNIPTSALNGPSQVAVVPMDVRQYWEKMEKRIDPSGRPYYWISGNPTPSRDVIDSDISALAEGRVTLTPLKFDMTHRGGLVEMGGWSFTVPPVESLGVADPSELRGPCIRCKIQRSEG